MYNPTLRDNVAQFLSNLILNTIATKKYRTYTEGFIKYGMNAAARDSAQNIDPPQDWRKYYLPEHEEAVIKQANVHPS